MVGMKRSLAASLRRALTIWGWLSLAVLVAVALAGCSNYDKARECQRQAGPTPHPVAAAFGLIGAAWSLDQPDTQAYNRAVDACMQEARR